MKLAFVYVILFVFLAGCGGGSSSDGAGGGDGGDGGPSAGGDSVPADVSGSYRGEWTGSGTNESGPFTCSGTFTLTISQSGSTLVVKLSVLNGTGECDDAFEFSGDGTYNDTTGEIAIREMNESTSANVNGTAMEVDLVISISGQWSILDTASAIPLASGTWSAEPL